jgi:hypothetical protein
VVVDRHSTWIIWVGDNEILWMPWSIITDKENLEYLIPGLQIQFSKQPSQAYPYPSPQQHCLMAISVSHLPDIDKRLFLSFSGRGY